MAALNNAADAVARVGNAVPEPWSRVEVLEQLLKSSRRYPGDIWRPLVALFGPERSTTLLLDWECGVRAGKSAWDLLQVGEVCLNFAEGFQSSVIPYLALSERDALRRLIQPRVDPNDWPTTANDPPRLPILLASALGGSSEVANLVESWPDRERPSAVPLHDQALELVLGLDHPEEVRRHVNRLRLRPQTAAQARGWLAHTELEGLDLVLESALAQKSRKVAEPLLRVLALARAPEAAPLMLRVMLKSQAPAIGREWLERHPGYAAPGLILPALGRGPAAEAARDFLQSLRRSGHGEMVDAALTAAGDGATKLRAALEDPPEVTAQTAATPPPPWLLAATAKPLLPRRTEWLPPGTLPAITLAGRALTAAEEEAVLSALQRSSLTEPAPLLAHLKRDADQHSLDAFLWRLCTLWQQRGRKVKETWALEAMGLLGGDSSALKLGPLAKEWREKQQHRIAGLAIDALAAIGSDTALAQLRAFTLIPRDWYLKLIAENHIKAAAKTRGLSADELEDRLVPDCGLGPGGAPAFDFGPRQFHLLLGAGLKPMVREAGSAPRTDLPKPNKKDDAALAERALADWKLLKKQLAEVLKMQSRRLEQAMIHGRRWSRNEFEAVFLQQPAMSLVARALVWGVHAPDGGRIATFRVSEDNSLADHADSRYVLPEAGEVSVPHPLTLTAEEQKRWGEQLADYGIIPPFPQIGRTIHRPGVDEAESDCLIRFNHLPCMAIALAEGLERGGWLRDDVGQGGCYYAHHRAFPSAGLTAVVEYQPGIYITNPWETPEQHLAGCAFYRGGTREGAALRLGEVDPIVFSEVVESIWTAVGRR